MDKVVISQSDTEEKILALFNDTNVGAFVTEPVSSTKLPCCGSFRAYGRLVGDRDLLGAWTIKEELFYGTGADIPDSPNCESIGQEWKGISKEDSVQVVSSYPPKPDEPELW